MDAFEFYVHASTLGFGLLRNIYRDLPIHPGFNTTTYVNPNARFSLSSDGNTLTFRGDTPALIATALSVNRSLNAPAYLDDLILGTASIHGTQVETWATTVTLLNSEIRNFDVSATWHVTPASRVAGVVLGDLLLSITWRVSER